MSTTRIWKIESALVGYKVTDENGKTISRHLTARRAMNHILTTIREKRWEGMA